MRVSLMNIFLELCQLIIREKVTAEDTLIVQSMSFCLALLSVRTIADSVITKLVVWPVSYEYMYRSMKV